MKINGHGQAKILTDDEVDLLFSHGFQSDRDRALFGVCLYTGCRISEALNLRVIDIAGGFITFRKSTTKGKLKTRQIPINARLREILDTYLPTVKANGYLFPSGKTHISRVAAHYALVSACHRVGLVGVSTNSFRRTTLTNLSSKNVPLRIIQEVSGHASLNTLQLYIEVSPSQVMAAIATLE